MSAKVPASTLRPGALALAALLGLACEIGEEPAALLGTVERTAVEVSSPVSEVLVEIAVTRGARVEEGQLLARLDDRLAVAERDAARARLEQARALLRETQPELKRVRGLWRAGAASSQQLDEAIRAHEQAVARELEVAALLAHAERRLSEHGIHSPVTGTVDQIPFDRGERVPPGGVVAVLLSDEAPWVRVWLPARKVAHVPLGTAARVLVHGLDGPLRGKVIEISRESEFTPHFALTEREREHLVYETRVEILDAPAGLRPGLPAEVLLDDLPAEGGT